MDASEIPQPDPAAIFAIALSLWKHCEVEAAAQQDFSLSECFNGLDEMMRQAMRIASLFETWSCAHISFDDLDEPWPYLLETNFGLACSSILRLGEWESFDDTDCLRIALGIRLPIKIQKGVPVPLDFTAPNPAPSAFRAYRVQTIRDVLGEEITEPFTQGDEPFDENFGPPYFGLYGVSADGTLEHILDRNDYSDIIALVRKLVPGIELPVSPNSCVRVQSFKAACAFSDSKDSQRAFKD